MLGAGHADTEENMQEIIDALNASQVLPEQLETTEEAFTSQIHLASSCEVLSICTHLASLPQTVSQLSALRELQLSGCTNLKQLPKDLAFLTALSELDLCHCLSVVHLPNLPITLRKLSLNGCTQLEALPSNLSTLTALNLNGCENLMALPRTMSALINLNKLDLCNCKKLEALPDLSRIIGLATVDTGLSCNREGVVYVHGVCPRVVRSWKACGYAPGCRNGLGEGFGTFVWLWPWLRKATVR